MLILDRLLHEMGRLARLWWFTGRLGGFWVVWSVSTFITCLIGSVCVKDLNMNLLQPSVSRLSQYIYACIAEVHFP